MPPRSSMNRSRSKSVSKPKYSGKNLPGSPSITLQDILKELNLTYDSSLGILSGDGIRTLPSLPVLVNLQKLLDILSSQLELVGNDDNDILRMLNKKLNGGQESEILNNADNGTESISDSVPDFVTKREFQKLEDNGSEGISFNKKRRLDEVTAFSEDADVVNDSEKDIDITEFEKPNDNQGERLNSASDPVPPVQTASFTHDHDTRLLNPKSEFVTSQTLPPAAHELGLFTEQDGGLEAPGIDYLKKKYAVASYPSSDLRDMLPGSIPNIDFSKNKPPTNQVQFTTYQTYMDPFFRPYGEEDLNLLKQKSIIPANNNMDSNYDPNLSPFIIPKLGQLYTDVWAMEDQNSNLVKLTSPPQQAPESVFPKGSIDDLSDETLYTEDISCGPLSSRLLSAILKDDSPEPSTKLGIINGEEYKTSNVKNDYQSLEERLKRELKYIGIFMNVPGPNTNPNPGKNNEITDNDWMANREDDEVCAEIRALQKELKEVVQRNNKRKKKLIPIVEEQVAWQEYMSILDDLDKQVDQAYIKRNKGSKHRKKKGASNSQPQAPTAAQIAQQAAANSGLKALLDKRERWIEKIGPLFKPAELMRRVPSTSIFSGVNFDEEDEEEVPEEEENDDNNENNNVTNQEISL